MVCGKKVYNEDRALLGTHCAKGWHLSVLEKKSIASKDLAARRKAGGVGTKGFGSWSQIGERCFVIAEGGSAETARCQGG